MLDFDRLKRVLIGRPLGSSAIHNEKLGILWGLPILSSDAISSVAYAGQSMLMVLIPAIGYLAYSQLTILSCAVIGLLMILTFSYRQTIESYPNGGGAYIVAKENLGIISGVTAGAALSVGYIMTVAVSICSGIEQLASAFTPLQPFIVPLSIVMVLILMLGNLRGIRESGRIFGIPAYAFVAGILVMIVTGFFKAASGDVPPPPTIKSLGEPITIILMLKAFSSGCTALTGIEAVSNSVPNFKSPSTKYARRVLLLLSIIILVLFGGTSILANIFQVVPGQKAMLVLMAEEIFGRNFMFYYITATTFIILVIGANTAYAGFPLLVSVMADEGYVPRQFNMRGDRLSYSNGILVLSVVSILLIIVFKANVSSLLGLYAIGVFISFTLSQFGMFMKWYRGRGKKWVHKAIINGFGGIVTSAAVIIISIVKFNEGAWIVVIVIPILILSMLKVKKHYTAVKYQLRVPPEELAVTRIEGNKYVNRVIVPIQSVNKSSIRALRYASTISENVTAFCVALDEGTGREIREKYDLLQTNIPLFIKFSPFRKVVDPLLRFIESAEYEYKKGDMITVILPQFAVKKVWHRLLHNQTRFFLERELLKHKHIVVAVMPLQLKDDKLVLEKMKNNEPVPLHVINKLNDEPQQKTAVEQKASTTNADVPQQETQSQQTDVPQQNAESQPTTVPQQTIENQKTDT